MQPQERQFVLEQLNDSEAQLLSVLDGLTQAQWHFRESADRWSIAENLEHLLLFEDFIRANIRRTLGGPSDPEKVGPADAKDPLVLGLATSRDAKLNARELVRPTGSYSSALRMIEEFSKRRAQTIAFASDTQAALREHFFPHIAFGDLDCYQWLVVLARHTLRHVAQIEQIKADPAYPVS